MRQQCVLLPTLQILSLRLHQKNMHQAPCLDILFAPAVFCFLCSNGIEEKSLPPLAVVRSLFKGPLLSPPSAFTGSHTAESLHNTAKVSQVEWELQTKFIREALLLSHKDTLAF